MPNRVHKKFVLLPLLLLILATWWPVSTSHAQGPLITPERLTLETFAGQCYNETLTVRTTDTPATQLDVVFLVDVTGSMLGVINQIRQNIQPIVDGVRAIAPDSVFALATVADYPGQDRDAGIEPFTLAQPFTTDVETLQQSLVNLTLYGSGDNEEAYLRALYETQFLDWRPNTRRVVILFGDAPPHSPDVGRDGEPGTEDDLTEADVAAQLTAANITILTASRSIPDFFQNFPPLTGGQFFFLSSINQIPDAIQDLLRRTLSRISNLTLHPAIDEAATSSGSEVDWITWTPVRHQAVEPGAAVRFATEICIPPEIAGDEYAFTLAALADGVPLDAPIDVVITVSTQADLALTATVQPDQVAVGEIFSYQLIISNLGIDLASGIVLNTTLPPELTLVSVDSLAGDCSQLNEIVSCTLNSLARNNQEAVILSVRADAPGTFTTLAEVVAREADLNPSNNQVTAAATVTGPAASPDEGDGSLSFSPNQPALTATVTLTGSLPAEDALEGTGEAAETGSILVRQIPLWFIIAIILLPFAGMLGYYLYERKIDPSP